MDIYIHIWNPADRFTPRRGKGRAKGRSARALPPALLVSAGFLVAADIRVAAPLLPAIADDFDVGVGTAGLTIAAYAFAYATGQVLYGRLGDRLGRIQVIRVALLLFSVGTALSAFAPTFPALVGLRLLTGVFAAGVIPMSLAYFGDTVTDYAARRRAIGVFLSVIVSGQVAGQALGGLLAGLLSWRAIFLVLGAAGVLAAAAIWSYPAPVQTASPTSQRGRFRTIFATDPTLYLMTVSETFFFLGSFAFAGASLIETRNASYFLVGILLGVFALGSFVTSKGLARIDIAETDASRVALGAVVVAAGLAVLALSPAPVVFAVASFWLGVGLTFAHSTLQTRATEVSPNSRGVAVSLFAGVANIGAATGTLVAGLVVDHFGFDVLFGAAAVGMLLVAGAAKRWLASGTAHVPPDPTVASPTVEPG